MTTYKVSTENSGVVFHRYLKFVDTGGPGFYSDGELVIFEGPFRSPGEVHPGYSLLSGYCRSGFLRQ